MPTPDPITSFRAFQGIPTDSPEERLKLIPAAPPWRTFMPPSRPPQYVVNESTIEVINAALALRRPVLIEGDPGVGKTTIAKMVTQELQLNPSNDHKPYRWSITSRSVLQDGLYSYDAIGRLHWASLPGNKDRHSDEDIGKFLRLGPLGTAFLKSEKGKPCVVLIDEIDKGDQDLPNDLLHLFEEGFFEIPEIQRMDLADNADVEVLYSSSGNTKAPVPGSGRISCEGKEFPLILMTSNGERVFPPAFLRRCLRLNLSIPTEDTKRREHFESVVKTWMDFDANNTAHTQLLDKFLTVFAKRDERHSPDQLLNAMHLLLRGENLNDEKREDLLGFLFANLDARD